MPCPYYTIRCCYGGLIHDTFSHLAQRDFGGSDKRRRRRCTHRVCRGGDRSAAFQFTGGDWRDAAHWRGGGADQRGDRRRRLFAEVTIARGSEVKAVDEVKEVKDSRAAAPGRDCLRFRSSTSFTAFISSTSKKDSPCQSSDPARTTQQDKS